MQLRRLHRQLLVRRIGTLPRGDEFTLDRLQLCLRLRPQGEVLLLSLEPRSLMRFRRRRRSLLAPCVARIPNLLGGLFCEQRQVLFVCRMDRLCLPISVLDAAVELMDHLCAYVSVVSCCGCSVVLRVLGGIVLVRLAVRCMCVCE